MSSLEEVRNLIRECLAEKRESILLENPYLNNHPGWTGHRSHEDHQEDDPNLRATMWREFKDSCHGSHGRPIRNLFAKSVVLDNPRFFMSMLDVLDEHEDLQRELYQTMTKAQQGY